MLLRRLVSISVGLSLLGASSAIAGDNLAHVRLISHDEPHIDVEASAPMQGDSVTFHLEGPLTNATVVVQPNRKYGATNVDVSGTILLSCSRSIQFMAGYSSIINGRLDTEMTLNCGPRPNSNFHIEITFPPHPLEIPSSPGADQNASAIS